MYYRSDPMQAIGNVFSGLVTALFGAITLLLVYESWALLTDHPPITTFIRPVVHSHPGEESIALRQGRDPMSNGVRAVIRRFPRVTYALAVVIGMLLGHLFWG